jgi:hypothetical protein
MDQRWLSVKEAAKYCGYKSADYFRKVAQEFRIPRYGPNGNRYDRADLDEWMIAPWCFMVQDNKSRRKPGEYKCIHSVLEMGY